MALDAGLVIRLGSGILYAALGSFVLWVGRGRWPAQLFGAHILLAAAYVIVFNLIRGESVLVATLGALPFALTGLLAALVLPTKPTRREWGPIGAGVAIGALAVSVRLFDRPSDIFEYGGETGATSVILTFLSLIVFIGVYGGFLVASLRLAATPRVGRERLLQAAGLAIPTGLWHMPGLTTIAAPDPFAPVSLGVTLLVAGTASLAWLVAATRGGGGLATAISWSFLAAPLAAYLVLANDGISASTGNDRVGLTGIFRILGFVAAAAAILKADLLKVGLPRLAERRGSLAAGALATLFVVAQVAQNYFSAEYGLLLGGVVAGAFLYAAQPIQRAFERSADRSPPSAVERTPSPAREVAYRAAVRRCLRDGKFSRDEERELAHLAGELGIHAGRAVEIRHEVEDELAGR